MIAVMMAAFHNPQILCDAATFDGSNDYMTRGAALTGGTNDEDYGVISVWVKHSASGDGTNRDIFSSETDAGFEKTWLRINTQDKFNLQLEGEVTFQVVDHFSGIKGGDTSWHHVLYSWDNAGQNFSFSYDDVGSDSPPGNQEFEGVDFANNDWVIGADYAAGKKYFGDMAELYISLGTYLDFSLVANRRKFISAGGKPVHLGADGSMPTGTAAIVYQHLDDGEAVANFATNAGTGGNFSITGTLVTAAGPSD